MNEIHKKGWNKTTFGEVCKNLNLSEHEPLASGIERYVGLEHIETGNLHIKRFGNVAEGTTFTKKFLSGHVLFGKRRAYLKKAAIADFDGICSGDILVFEANEKIIHKKLLPFLVSSDRFFDFAVQTSAGSLSPRTKFQDLTKFEFLLPPKEQQAKLAEFLWAGDDVVEKYTDLEKTIVKSILYYTDKELFYSKPKKELRKKQKLIEYCVNKPKYGANAASKPYVLNSPRYIRITDINDDGRLIETGIVSIDSENYEEYLLHEGDFLFARTGNTVGKTFLFRNSDGISVYAGYLIKFSLDVKKLKPEILEIFCKSTTYQRFLKSVVKVGAQPNINAEQYSNIEIPLISIEEQNEILKQYSYLNKSLVEIRKNLNCLKQIQKQLINQIFGG